MDAFCPNCGKILIELRFLPKYQARVYKCFARPTDCFVEILSARNVYPLQILDSKATEILVSAPEDLLDLAFKRIKYIDYKTISIVYFEQTLLGAYRDKEYKIVYPD